MVISGASSSKTLPVWGPLMIERTGTTSEALFMRSGAVASLLGMRKTRVVSFCSMFAMGTPYWKIGIHPKYRQLSFHSSASGTRSVGIRRLFLCRLLVLVDLGVEEILVLVLRMRDGRANGRDSLGRIDHAG